MQFAISQTWEVLYQISGKNQVENGMIPRLPRYSILESMGIVSRFFTQLLVVRGVIRKMH